MSECELKRSRGIILPHPCASEGCEVDLVELLEHAACSLDSAVCVPEETEVMAVEDKETDVVCPQFEHCLQEFISCTQKCIEIGEEVLEQLGVTQSEALGDQGLKAKVEEQIVCVVLERLQAESGLECLPDDAAHRVYTALQEADATQEAECEVDMVSSPLSECVQSQHGASVLGESGDETQDYSDIVGDVSQQPELMSSLAEMFTQNVSAFCNTLSETLNLCAGKHQCSGSELCYMRSCVCI